MPTLHSEAPSFGPKQPPGPAPALRAGQAERKRGWNSWERAPSQGLSALCLPQPWAPDQVEPGSKPRLSPGHCYLSAHRKPPSEGRHFPQGVHFQELGIQVLPWEAEREGLAQDLAPAPPPWAFLASGLTLCQLHRLQLKRDAILPAGTRTERAQGHRCALVWPHLPSPRDRLLGLAGPLKMGPGVCALP